MKPNKKYSQSSMLVYSYLSFGLFGILGLRDMFLVSRFKSIIKLGLMLIFLTFSSLFLMNAVQSDSIGAFLAGGKIDGDLLFYSSIIFIVLGISVCWEIIDSLLLLKDSVCDRYQLRKWENQKSKIILTCISWPQILGISFFLMGKKKLGQITVAVLLIVLVVCFMMSNVLWFYAFYSLSTFIALILIIKFVLNGQFRGDESDFQSTMQKEEKNDLKVLYSSNKKFITILLWYVFGKYGAHDFYNKKWQSGTLKILLQLVIGFSLMMILNPPSEPSIFYRVSFLLSFIVSVILVFLDICHLFLNKYKNSQDQIIAFVS